MWCRSILRCAVSNNFAVSTYLRCCTRNNDAALRHPERRSLASNTSKYTVSDAIDQWSRRFEAEGISEPMKSIEHIVAHVIGTKKITDILNVKNDLLNANQIEKLKSLCECRLLRMPVQYIIGDWDFHDITLKLIPPIFIPWPETEMLVSYILKRLNSLQAKSCDILEIGCGSGAISLALAHAYEKMTCVMIDMNQLACDLTTINRDKLNLTDRVTVMHATLKPDAMIEVSKNDDSGIDLNSRLFDFVISNPPYVSTKKLLELQPETKHEDLRAMDGGDDGLKVIKPVVRYAAKALKPGGRLFMEVDINHPECVRSFTNEHPDLKLHYEHAYKDFCNNDRFVEVLKVA